MSLLFSVVIIPILISVTGGVLLSIYNKWQNKKLLESSEAHVEFQAWVICKKCCKQYLLDSLNEIYVATVVNGETVTPELAQHVEELYASYTFLGGNGWGTQMYKEILHRYDIQPF